MPEKTYFICCICGEECEYICDVHDEMCCSCYEDMRYEYEPEDEQSTD